MSKETPAPKEIIWSINRYGELSLPADSYIKQKEEINSNPISVAVQSEYASRRTGGIKSEPPQRDFQEASRR